MADYDICLTPVKRSSFDAGRKLRFWDDDGRAVAATVKDLSGNELTQPITVPANGHLNVRFDQWPVYYTDNRGWTRVKRVPGMPATISGLTQAAVEAAIGTGGNLVADLAVDYADDGTAKDLDTDAKRIAAANATNTKINAAVTRLNAATAKMDAILAKLKTAGVIASS